MKLRVWFENRSRTVVRESLKSSEESGLEIGRTQTCLYVGRDEHMSLYSGR
jgi:hypothetical protein